MNESSESGAFFNQIKRDLNARFVQSNLALAINSWLKHNKGADPQTGRNQAALRIVGDPEFREVAPMEYEFTVRLRIDMRKRRRR
jgi:hypothetical protein